MYIFSTGKSRNVLLRFSFNAFMLLLSISLCTLINFIQLNYKIAIFSHKSDLLQCCNIFSGSLESLIPTLVLKIEYHLSRCYRAWGTLHMIPHIQTQSTRVSLLMLSRVVRFSDLFYFMLYLKCMSERMSKTTTYK
jgi:hypothetical protein